MRSSSNIEIVTTTAVHTLRRIIFPSAKDQVPRRRNAAWYPLSPTLISVGDLTALSRNAIVIQCQS